MRWLRHLSPADIFLYISNVDARHTGLDWARSYVTYTEMPCGA